MRYSSGRSGAKNRPEQFYKTEPHEKLCRIGLKWGFSPFFREIVPSGAILHIFEALRVTSNPKRPQKNQANLSLTSPSSELDNVAIFSPSLFTLRSFRASSPMSSS